MRSQEKSWPLSPATKVLLAFVAAVLVVAVLGAAAWKETKDVMEAERWVVHSYQVLESIHDTTRGTLLVETATRGYIISGAAGVLAERDAAIAARELSLRRIGQLTVGNARQQALWQQLSQALDVRAAISARAVQLRATAGFDAARAYSATDVARKSREHMFQVSDAMETEERRLLQERGEEQQRMRQTRAITSAITALAAMALLLVTFFMIRRQLRSTEASRAALAASNERIRAILDSVGEGLHGIDLDGNIVFANPAGIAMLGRDLDELIGQPAHTLLHHTRADGSAYPKEECKIFATLRDGVSRQVEDEVFWRKDGTSFPAAYTSVGMRSEAGESTGALVSFHDITTRKQAEQSLIAAKNAAELANRAKDSFLATMSHEIRTPLGGLLGMLELLSLSGLNREQDETLQTARDSGRSLLRILNDILDWSKIEEGKLELALQPTSLAQLLAEVANTYAHVASTHSVTLTQQVDARLAPAHLVDPLRLSQVLNNFISNAIKFSHSGRVDLRVELLARHEGSEEVRFSVKDTGIGIAPEVQQRLFQSYGQASADTARMYGGTGLGLAICKRLADLLGARIEVESAPGRGSTFSLTLPLPLAEGAPAPAPKLARSLVAEARPAAVRDIAADAPLVLVVDDNSTNRKLLARQLGMLGLRTATAEHGQAGLALWRAGGFDLVITDCHMPVMDGYALARAIRQAEAEAAAARLPIIAWTANTLADESEKYRAAGMDELLVKPAALPQLQQMLEKYLPAGLPSRAGIPTAGAVPPAPTFNETPPPSPPAPISANIM